MKSHNPKIRSPRCLVIAGPNGAGKTTFAREFLPREAGVMRFVNADLIAAGLSPCNPNSRRSQPVDYFSPRLIAWQHPVPVSPSKAL